MAINEDEIKFALRLWDSLIPNGEWLLPNVGKYIKTGTEELTLTEMHQATLQKAAIISNKASINGRSLFDHHDFICYLGKEVGWEIKTEIEKAYDYKGEEMNIPLDRIGDVAVCSKNCGLVIRIEPATPWKIFQQIDEQGVCPFCNKVSFDKAWYNIHVVTDSTAIKMRKSRHSEEE